MNRTEKKMNKISRRDFIRKTTAAIGGTAIAGLGVESAGSDDTTSPRQWNIETDVG